MENITKWSRKLFKFGYHFSADYEQLEEMSKTELIEYRNMLDDFQKFQDLLYKIRDPLGIEIQIKFNTGDLKNLWMNPHLILEARTILNHRIVKLAKVEMEKMRNMKVTKCRH